MGIIVQKFGGSSVANLEKLELVSEHIIKEVERGNKLVVVVSAQGKTTDKLIAEEAEITKNPDKREHDVLVSTGEQITIAKLAMLLIEKNYKAVSLAGWQIPIITNSEFSNSRIRYIHNDTINEYLDSGNIVIVAGFQGIDENGNITTFGRGGSDTTAVALAASLGAERCDIFTDVDGVYTSDPRIVENVIKLKTISYDEMLEMSSMGAKVLHNRCVEIGKKYNVPIYVKSTFEKNSIGTLVNNKNLEDLVINGVTKDNYISRITIVGLENKIGKTYKLFKLLSENLINVDIIVQSFGEYITKDIAFTVKMNDLEKTLKVLEENKEKLGAKEILHSENLAKVSIIGVGIANKPGVAADMFEALYENNINMHMVTTSEIKISVLVDSNQSDLAVKKIHQKFFGK
ncbi:MAG TPA: aspartate kinase [Candidatus Scatovivens faecipullorum]|nr:aspartate kinase [Candidatus Scatovivens faecipullorum]